MECEYWLVEILLYVFENLREIDGTGMISLCADSDVTFESSNKHTLTHSLMHKQGAVRPRGQ